jgi:hypothetical protein
VNQKIKIVFLLLVLTQGVHSVEEYIGKLWEVLLPARIISGFFSKDLQTGFLIFNIILFVFGAFCWLVPVRKNYSSAPAFILFWIIIELINGIGHPLWSISVRAYRPGLFTAPLLLLLSSYLCVLILNFSRRV